jgi:site-specific recombinase XerD
VNVKPKRFLELEQVNKILLEIDFTPVGLRDRAMIGIFYGLELKPSEGLDIHVEDFNVDRSQLYIRKSKRMIDIAEKVQIWIRDYINYGRPQLLIGKEDNMNDALFITYRGNKASLLTLNRRIKYLQNKTGCKQIQKKNLSLSSLTYSRFKSLKNPEKIISNTYQIISEVV